MRAGFRTLSSVAIDIQSERAEKYATDGFFKVDGFADASVGQAMLDDVVEIVRRSDRGEQVDALVLPEAQPDFAARDDAKPEDVIAKVFKLHRRPAFASFLRTPELLPIVTGLLGTDDVDCFLSQFIFKNPGAWGQPWHQDSYYFPFEPARPIIGLWLAVTEATLENGCLHVLSGSHAEPVHEHIPDRRPGANYGYMEIVDHDMDGQMPSLMEPGDLLVFDSHLMHRSTDNVSGGIRAAMVFHVAAAGTVDNTEKLRGYKSPVNDWVPLIREGVFV
jgi:ectoine hydroxylase-related dioxygenase (phytanoyl-CoA dioxygenase family)